MVDLDAIREGMAEAQAIDPDEAGRRLMAVRLAMLRTSRSLDRKRAKQATKRRAKR
jgi:hypothetical protein